MCDYSDGLPEFYLETLRKAKKSHRCDECSADISPGENYMYISAKYDSVVQSYKQCEFCHCSMHGDHNENPCIGEIWQTLDYDKGLDLYNSCPTRIKQLFSN
jgi:hypothetical protein